MAFSGEDVEARIRDEAFRFLTFLGDPPVVSQRDLESFNFDGVPMRLMAPQQGIWKPRQLSAALSIRSVFFSDPAKRPYADEIGTDQFLRYKWRGTEAQHPDNRALREAMRRGLPLIWFEGIDKGRYYTHFPVFLADEEPEERQFVVALDFDSYQLRKDLFERDPEVVRRYGEQVIKTRLHQQVFRERVLIAYDSQCSVCRLRHRELLDAAHVIGDAAGGEPVVPNGISMCKLHHAAYDADFFGISPGYKIAVRPDVLNEVDGPTLRYSLQAINGGAIQLPRRTKARPDRARLEIRWNQFMQAS